MSITGSAGTGKTLLTYDIAKDLKEDRKKYLIIHCGLLNSGHDKLNDEHDWEIIPIILPRADLPASVPLSTVPSPRRP